MSHHSPGAFPATHSSDNTLSNNIRALLVDSERLRLSDLAASIECAEQALHKAEQLEGYEHHALYFESQIELAAALQAGGMHERALVCINRARNLLEYHDSDEYVIKVSIILATIQISLGDTTQALASLDYAQKLAQSQADLASEVEILANIGLAYGWLDSTDKAREYLHQALSLSEQLPVAPRVMISLLNNIAYAYFLLNDLETAHIYAERALEHAQQAQGFLKQVTILGTLSDIAAKGGDLKVAEQYLEEGRRISEIAGIPQLQTINLRAWTTFYIDTNQLDQAIASCKACLAISEERAIKPMIDECLRRLSMLYERQGDLSSALEYLKSASKVRDTIHNERINYRIDTQKAAYQHELLRQEHKSLSEKNTLLEQLVNERDQSLIIQQQLLEDIAELSTPVLPLLPGVLVVPLVGSLDAERVTRIHENILHSIEQAQTRVMLLDITGVPLVDTQMAADLILIVQAAQLLGCRVIMVGIRPEIAQSLVGLGIDLSRIMTRASLADGLTMALGILGYSIGRRKGM